MGKNSEAPKTFSNAYIRRLNAECAKTECADECEGIGWCSEVYRRVRKKTSDRIRAVSAVVFLMGIGSIGFLVGLGIHSLVKLVW